MTEDEVRSMHDCLLLSFNRKTYEEIPKLIDIIKSVFENGFDDQRDECHRFPPEFVMLRALRKHTVYVCYTEPNWAVKGKFVVRPFLFNGTTVSLYDGIVAEIIGAEWWNIDEAVNRFNRVQSGIKYFIVSEKNKNTVLDYLDKIYNHFLQMPAEDDSSASETNQTDSLSQINRFFLENHIEDEYGIRIKPSNRMVLCSGDKLSILDVQENYNNWQFFKLYISKEDNMVHRSKDPVKTIQKIGDNRLEERLDDYNIHNPQEKLHLIWNKKNEQTE